MAHQLAETNGQTAMMYAGEAPWHGLGTRLERPANAEQAIMAAGLDYEVELSSLATVGGLNVPKRKAVVRTDQQQVLGVVGSSYRPIQNQECFSFLDAVVADEQLEYHTAGALGQGEKVWMLTKLPHEIRLKNSEDVTEQYLLLSNSHNGSSSLRVFFTPIRVVCSNTLGMAERRGRHSGVSIMHKGNLDTKVTEAQRILGLANRFYADLETKMERMANHYPSQQQLQNYFTTLYPDSEKPNRKRPSRIQTKLTELFEAGKGQTIPEIQYSTWAAFNAVTEYVDHHRATRGKDSRTRQENRLNSAWFGSGAQLKANAWKLALEMAV